MSAVARPGVFANLVSFGTDLSGLDTLDVVRVGALGQGPLDFITGGLVGGVKTFEEFGKLLPAIAQILMVAALVIGIAFIAAIVVPPMLSTVGAITSVGRFGLGG